MMDTVLYQTTLENLPLLGTIPVVITSWKLVGYLGVFLFAGRWFVQMIASRRNGRPTIPRMFWYMSVMGSTLLVAYFLFGKRDSVGLLSNLFPMTVAFYNLYLDVAHKSKQATA